MPSCHRLIGAILPLATLISLPTIVQAQPSTQADDLRIGARIGVGANSPNGGTETTTRLETFLPIWQQPGQSLTFLEGRLLIDDRGNPGGNVVLGHRQYSKTFNRTLGGHLGFDIRNTDANTFQQLGLGLESLGEDVDLYLNGFWPVGATQRQTGQSIVDTGLQLNGQPRFGGNALLLDLQRQRWVTRQFEEALAGVDFEVGKQLLKFKNGGDLQAFLGPYFLHSGIRGNTFGIRSRLQMQPTRNISAGVGLQHDDFFGTQASGNLTFTFPGNRPKGPIPSEKTVLARMGSSVNRNNNVIVDTPTTTEILDTENRTVAAINPATGQPWFFNHVNLGLGNSDGSFESPFATVAEALAATRGDGNDIVYVAQGTNPGIPAFTVPDNVQMRSQGPTQRIAISPINSQLSTPSTLDLSTVQLPASGNGQLPTVTGTVTMRNNTLLSGFAINPNGANGVEAEGVENVVIDQNQITNADNGIRLQDVTGNLEVTNNVVTQTADDGIDLGLENTSLNSVLISGNTVSNVGDDGIDIDVYDNSQLNSVTISGNTVSEVDEDGIVLDIFDNGQANSVTISNNTVSEVDEDGINVDVEDNSQADSVTISGNTVSEVGEDGIDVDVEDNSQVGSVTISDNTVSDVASEAEVEAFLSGINLTVSDNSQVNTATLSRNRLTTDEDFTRGIDVFVEIESTIAAATVADNQVITSGRSADGIAIEPIFNSTITTANITGNTVTTAERNADGIFIQPVLNSSITTANITGNTITTSERNANGIVIEPIFNGTVTTANITGNTVTTAERNADGIVIQPYYNGTITTANITGNTVTTAERNADGIVIQPYYSGTITTANITGNTITTSGINADGILVRANQGSTITTANITGNTVTTSGDNADGILVRTNQNSTISTANILNNSIPQAGRDSVRVRNIDGNPICAVISGNRSDNPDFAMAGGTDIDLRSSRRSVFQLVNLDTVSADNNNATLRFNNNLVPPGAPPANFANVASCP